MLRNPFAFLSLYIILSVDSEGKSYYIRQQRILQSLFRNPGSYNITLHKYSNFKKRAPRFFAFKKMYCLGLHVSEIVSVTIATRHTASSEIQRQINEPFCQCVISHLESSCHAQLSADYTVYS